MGLAAADFVAPDPAGLRLALPGGAAAFVVADHTVPLIRFSALIGAGRADTADAADYAAAMRNGPATMTATDFGQALARMAAEYDVVQEQTETRVTLDVPREDAALALQLFAALLRTGPKFERRSAGGQKGDEPASGESGPVLYEGSLASTVRLFNDKLFAQHAYGGHHSGSAHHGTATFHDDFVVPENVVLAVAGDFDVASMRAELAAAFAGWDGLAPALVEHPVPDLPPSRRVLTYPADKLQGWIVMGHELPEIPVEDEAALMVMNYILGGGHFDTRLFRVTRDRRGLTNDDSGFPVQGFRGPGVYTFRTYGRPQVVRLLIQLTLEEIERIRDEPVDDEDLFVARGALADGDFSLWFRDGAATATTYAREWLRYRNHERTASWQERVRAVTAEDVLAAARRYLHPERMQIVVVGPIDAIEEAPAREGEPGLSQFGLRQ
jgi:zinc protease